MASSRVGTWRPGASARAASLGLGALSAGALGGALWLVSSGGCSFPKYSFEPDAAGGAGRAGEGGGGGEGQAGAGGEGGEGQAGEGASGEGGAGGGAGSAPGVLIARGQQNVGRMVAHESTLFWVVAGTSAQGFHDGKALACPTAGCPETGPLVLATGLSRPRHLVSGNLFVYWLEEVEGGRLYKYQKGTTDLPIALSVPLATPTRLTLAAGRLFAVDRGSATNQYADGKIVWADPSNNDQDVFIDGQKNPFSVVADDGTNVYWNADGSLLSCAFARRCTGGAKVLATGVGAGDLAYDGRDLFFVVGDEIRRVPRP